MFRSSYEPFESLEQFRTVEGGRVACVSDWHHVEAGDGPRQGRERGQGRIGRSGDAEHRDGTGGCRQVFRRNRLNWRAKQRRKCKRIVARKDSGRRVLQLRGVGWRLVRRPHGHDERTRIATFERVRHPRALVVTRVRCEAGGSNKSGRKQTLAMSHEQPPEQIRAHCIPYDMCALDERVVEHSEDVEFERGILGRIVRLVAFAVPSTIEREHSTPRGEEIDGAIPDPAAGVVCEAVKEDNRIAGAVVQIVEANPARLEEPRLHRSGCYRSSHRTAHVMSSFGRKTTIPVSTSAGHTSLKGSAQLNWGFYDGKRLARRYVEPHGSDMLRERGQPHVISGGGVAQFDLGVSGGCLLEIHEHVDEVLRSERRPVGRREVVRRVRDVEERSGGKDVVVVRDTRPSGGGNVKRRPAPVAARDREIRMPADAEGSGSRPVFCTVTESSKHVEVSVAAMCTKVRETANGR
jgi:hypothetical protein